MVATIIYHVEISQFIVKNFIYHNYAVESIQNNSYTQNHSYQFVQTTDDFVAEDYHQLLNIFYTVLDSGEDSFYFFCSEDYVECTNDVKELTPAGIMEESVLSDLNNFVHPYNTYKSISVTPNNFGKVKIVLEKQYTESQIAFINEQIENIKSQIEKDGMSTRDKILAFHNYIINYAKYDKERADNMDDPKFANSNTHTAYGLLTEKKALCGGYSDLMSIYLYSINVPNIRIATKDHVWNLVYLDNEWLHLDVTWDDPIVETGEDLLLTDYFLISFNKLLEIDNLVHNFDESIYPEAK